MNAGSQLQVFDEAPENDLEIGGRSVGMLIVDDLLHVVVEVEKDLLFVEDRVDERTRVVLRGKTMQAAGEFFEQVVESTEMLLSEGRVGVSGVAMLVHLIQQTTEC